MSFRVHLNSIHETFIEEMKSLIVGLFLLPTAILAQEISNDTITVKQTLDATFAGRITNGTNFKVAILNHGNKISIGDTLIIGNPSTQNIKVTSSGNSVNAMSTFSTLYQSKPTAKGVLIVWDETPYLKASWSKRPMIVERIFVTHNKYFNKETKLNIGVVMREVGGGIVVYANRAPISIENGELELKNKKMTKAEAIEKLKEAKTLLDLQMITEAEYFSLRDSLAPIIRGASETN